MGRPKIVTFTGLEDLESQDSRPAKKKKQRKDFPALPQLVTSDEQITGSPVESAQDLTSELATEAATEIITPSLEAIVAEKPSETKKPKVGKAKVRSKRYQSLISLVEKGKAYPLTEALEALKSTAKTAFDPTIEIHINVGADITKTDQVVRTTTKLPHSIGKAPKLLIFGDFKAEEGIAVGDDKTIDQIEKTGKVEGQKIIATPEWMPKLTKVAKILGPKGLMPNPKTGTVTTDIAKTVADFKGGLIEVRTEVGGPIIHSRVGKLSLGDEKITENLKALIEAINKAKPVGIKRNYLKSAYLHVTMGPSIRLDLSSL